MYFPFVKARVKYVGSIITRVYTADEKGVDNKRQMYHLRCSFFCATADISSAYTRHLFLIICDSNRCYRTAIVTQSLLPSSKQTTYHKHAYATSVWTVFTARPHCSQCRPLWPERFSPSVCLSVSHIPTFCPDE